MATAKKTDKKVPALLQQLITEKKELDAKLNKLNAFITSEKIKTYRLDLQACMVHQASAMCLYSHFLEERIFLLSIPKVDFIGNNETAKKQDVKKAEKKSEKKPEKKGEKKAEKK